MLNERGHIAKMLKRAQRRQSAANILVDKWTARLEALGPAPQPDILCCGRKSPRNRRSNPGVPNASV